MSPLRRPWHRLVGQPKGFVEALKFGQPTVFVEGGTPTDREEYRLTRVVLLDVNDNALAEFVGPKRWTEGHRITRRGRIEVWILSEHVRIGPMTEAIARPMFIGIETNEFGMKIPNRVVPAREVGESVDLPAEGSWVPKKG